MGKLLLGLLLGAVLGAIDGLGALVSAGDDPAIGEGIVSIVIGSKFNGILVGVSAGLFARKFNSVPAGVVFGLIVGCILAAVIAIMQGKYYVEIILPGSILGAIVGFATQRFGATPAARTG